jgi:phosphate uptake regulator
MLKLTQLYEIFRSDNSLNQAIEQSRRMLDRTQAMFSESVSALREAGGTPRMNISEEDQLVNEDQQEARRKVFRHLAVTGGLNLRAGLVLTSIVIDIERIGDYTKNIRELADAHPGRLNSGQYDADIHRIEQAVAALFEGTVDVVRSGHTEGARSLIREHLWIKKRCDEIARDLAATPGSALKQNDAVTTALYARYLKRVGAHLMNILSSLTNPFERIGYRESSQDPDTSSGPGVR